VELNLYIKYDEGKKMWIVSPVGDVDIYTSPKLKEVLIDSFNKQEANILIDGEKLEYVDSTGVGVLIGILKRAREKGYDVYIKNIKPNIRKLFDITGLDKVFIIEE
jgi:anti-sigma B factor antagonist